MRKSYWKKSLAVLLSAMMLPSLVACGNGSDDKAKDSVESESKSEEKSEESGETSGESKTEESSESTDAENIGGGRG
ncbi:MAG: hypothetical protein HFH94_03900 [Lachnospiraceae bacterium]|nr:hypothetical protein [Lachnospiraceae bacterium]